MTTISCSFINPFLYLYRVYFSPRSSSKCTNYIQLQKRIQVVKKRWRMERFMRIIKTIEFAYHIGSMRVLSHNQCSKTIAF